MNRISLFKIAFVSGGNVMNAVIGFFFLAVVAKTLTLEEFGRYALLTSILLVFSKLVDFGANSIYVTKSLIEEDTKTITESFHTLKALMLLFTLPLSYGVVQYFFPSQPTIHIIFLIGLFAYTINFTLYAHFQRSEKFTHLILLNTLPAFFKVIAAVLILMGTIRLTLISAFALFSFSILADLILVPFLPVDYRHFKFNSKHIKTILIKGFPSGVSQLVQEGWPAINNTITKYVRDYSDVGVFSLASKISNIFSLLSLSVFTVLLPKNAKLRGQKKTYDIKETLLISGTILLLAIGAIVFAGILLNLIFGDKFAGSLYVLDILIFASAISAIHTFTENYFLVEEQNNYIFWINIIKLVSFGIPAYTLSGTYGIEGVAVSNLIAAITALLSTIYFINRHRISTS